METLLDWACKAFRSVVINGEDADGGFATSADDGLACTSRQATQSYYLDNALTRILPYAINVRVDTSGLTTHTVIQ